MAEEGSHSTKIIRSDTRWSELPKELCQHILSASTLRSINRFKAVCPSWSTAVDEMIKSPTFTWSPEPPWLVLPGYMNKGQAIDDGSSRFYSFDGNLYKSNNNMPEESRDAICFGSSQGWLVLLNNQLEFMLTTPFLPGIQLPLPPLNTFPDILGITNHKGTTYAYNIVDHFKLVRKTGEKSIEEDITSLRDLGSKLRTKAVLSSRPTCSNKHQIGVMVIYMFGSKAIKYKSLAFCSTSDHKWTKLEEREWYLDIMGQDNEFYVLLEDFSVDVWDFGTSTLPMKKKEIKPDACVLLAALTKRFHTVYMLKTAGTGLMLVVVDFRLYSSKLDRFHVYNLVGREWKEVKSIGSNALVLGLNNSIVMSHHDSLRCDSDSIYYVKKSRSESYNLHVFSLKDRSKKEVCKLPVDFEPLAFLGS